MKFYKICWNNRWYIGELANTTTDGDFMKYHLKYGRPWHDFKTDNDFSGEQGRWERKLQTQVKKEGWLKTLQSITVAESIDADVLLKQLKTSLDNAACSDPDSPYDKKNYIAGSLWNDIYSIYTGIQGQGPGNHRASPEILIAEMLLICAAAIQNGIVWNTHANIGPRFNRPMTAEDVKLIINADEMKRQEETIHQWLPKIYYSFHLNDYTDKIKNLIKGTYKTYGIDVYHINIIKEKDFIKATRKVVQDSTIKSLVSQLTLIRDRIKTRPSAALAVAKLNSLIDAAERKDLGKTYATLSKSINDAFTKDIDLNDVELTTPDFRENLVKVLLRWLSKFKWTGSAYDMNEAHLWAKRSTYNWIRDVLFSDLEYDKEYSALQHEKWLDSKRKAFLPQNDYDEEQSIMEQTLNDIPSDYEFIISKWKYGLNRNESLYGQAMSIWLKRNRDTVYHDNFFTWQPLTDTDLTIY